MNKKFQNIIRLREVALRYLGLSPAIPVDAPTIPPQTAEDPAPKAAVKEPPEDVPSKNCDSNVEASEKVG